MLKEEKTQTAYLKKDSKKLSLSTQGMELNKFLRWISDNGNVSVVAESNLDTRLVVLDVVNQPVSEILGVVARRLGVQVTRSGTLYFLGDLKPEDRGVYVRKVTRLDADEVYQAVAILLSEHGRCVTYPDGMCLVGDRVEVINKIDELLNSIQAIPADSWVVQYYVLSVTEGHEKELGVDISSSLDLAFTLHNGEADILNNGLLSALIRAEKSTTLIDMVAQPLMAMLDGKQATFNNGEILRVPQKTVSDQGTVTTTGYETINTGLTLVSSIRDLGGSKAKLKTELTMAQLINYIEDAPVLSNDSFFTEVSIESGGVYLIGSLNIINTSDRNKHFLNSYEISSQEKRQIQIYVKAHKIKGEII